MAHPWNQSRLYNPESVGAPYRHPAHSGTMTDLLGLPPKAKLPDEGIWPPVYIQGVKVWVNSKSAASHFKQFHRVRCECPMCGAEMSAGRLNQHTCK